MGENDLFSCSVFMRKNRLISRRFYLFLFDFLQWTLSTFISSSVSTWRLHFSLCLMWTNDKLWCSRRDEDLENIWRTSSGEPAAATCRCWDEAFRRPHRTGNCGVKETSASHTPEFTCRHRQQFTVATGNSLLQKLLHRVKYCRERSKLYSMDFKRKTLSSCATLEYIYYECHWLHWKNVTEK